MAREKKRLAEAHIMYLRSRYQGDEDCPRNIGLLLDHIDVAEAEIVKLHELVDAGGFDVVFRLAQAEDANRRLKDFVDGFIAEGPGGEPETDADHWEVKWREFATDARALQAELNQ